MSDEQKPGACCTPAQEQPSCCCGPSPVNAVNCGPVGLGSGGTCDLEQLYPFYHGVYDFSCWNTQRWIQHGDGC